jgi:hypothetical protein
MKCADRSCKTVMVQSATHANVWSCPACGYSEVRTDAAFLVAPVPEVAPVQPPTPAEMDATPLTGACESCGKPCRPTATFCLSCRIERDLVASKVNEQKRRAREASRPIFAGGLLP